MRKFIIEIECCYCDNNHVEIEIGIDAPSESPNWDYPGAGAEWHVEDVEVKCKKCGEVLTADYIDNYANETVQKREAEED